MNDESSKTKYEKNIQKKDFNFIEYNFNPKHTIKDLASILKVSNFFLIKKLIKLGIKANINHKINKEIIEVLAHELKFKVIIDNKIYKSFDDKNDLFFPKEDKKKLTPRVPIVIIMGHVDHGKTTLLDTIRKTHTTHKEFGGITQHIGAYQIICDNGDKITFIDSPGHEAFFKMRSRSAKITDICLLVVAADDGVQEQTIESIKHAQEAKIDIIVVINKIDKHFNKENIMTELSNFDLIPEEWGGKTLYVEISALKNKGIDDLLNLILLTRDMKDIKTDLTKLSEGVVLESELDKNKGPVATLISFQGIFKTGDFIVIEDSFSKIRSIENDFKKRIKQVFPSQPVLVTGLSKVPKAGDNFFICHNIKQAKILAEETKKLKQSKKIINEKEIFDIQEKKFLESKEEVKEKFLNIVLKTDRQGSIEAIIRSLEGLQKDYVKVKFVKTSVGMITNNDIQLAKMFNAVLIGFNISINNNLYKMAQILGIEMKNYNILYQMIEYIKDKLEKMVDPIFEEKLTGKAKVQKIFNISSIGSIAGCFVIEGNIFNNSDVSIMRDNHLIIKDKIISLKHLKNNISQANQGHECGILLEKFSDFKLNDIIESYKKEKVNN
ncbi:translation initiation factor IF-2 [Candidatus Phytoplasma oryzae]|nr:translation initiation factor IF-2 [Candidatus Phytoplasma oryzae]RAM58004.1 translation initiation factor IF-2 [Candidatus Phytoplasma oryzae]